MKCSNTSLLTSWGFLYVVLTYVFLSCNNTPASTNDSGTTKFKQYYLQGEQLYQNNCANCHQKTGTGLGLIYPPLNKSDFMKNHVEEVICLIKHGTAGELIVNGKSFNKKMPGIPSLTNLEIAEIATYIYNTWEHQHGIIEVKYVDSVLTKCTE